MAVIFPIKSTFDPKGVNSAKKAFNGLSQTVTSSSGLMKAALIGVGTSTVVRGLQSAVMAASALSESIAKSDTVFGGNAKAIEEWSKTTAKSLGVSQQAALEAAGTYGNLFRAFGISEGESAKMSQSLVTLAADLASFNNVPIEDSILALRSGLSGETEPLKRFGIAINEVRLKEEALRLGLITTTKGTLPQAIKTQAAYALILKDSALAQGDVERTSDGLANQLKFVTAGLEDAKAGFGEALLPAALSVVTAFNDKVLPALEVFINALTGKQSLSSSFTGAQEKAFVFGNVVRAVIETIVNYQRFIVGFGAALAAMFVIAKVSAAAGAIVSIIGGIVKALQTLRTVGIAATIATAFATGGVSVAAGAAGAVAAAAAIALAFAGINKVMDNYKENVESLPTINIEPPDTGASAFQDIVLPTADTTGGGGGAGSSSANASAAMAKVVATASKAATKALEGMNNALSAARDRLQAARDAYAEYKHSVKDAIISQFDFSSALSLFKDRQNTAKDASKRLADAQKEYNEALKSKNVERISDALKELTAAQKDNARATRNNKTFMQTLREQANQAVNFARKVRTLISMGLSQAGIDQVLAAGAEAGTAIANELIAGGTTAIAETNALLNSVQNAATTIGTSAANAFFQAGVTQGQAMVNGIIQAVQAAGFIIKGGTIVLPANLQKALDSGKLTPAQVTELNAILKGVPKLAEGGIVNKPTLALIGEAGPEAVVPLSKMGGSKSNTYNITVNAGMGTNGGQVGREIVDAIKKYERTNGPVFASA
jgi:hypothetical protein